MGGEGEPRARQCVDNRSGQGDGLRPYSTWRSTGPLLHQPMTRSVGLMPPEIRYSSQQRIPARSRDLPLRTPYSITNSLLAVGHPRDSDVHGIDEDRRCSEGLRLLGLLPLDRSCLLPCTRCFQSSDITEFFHILQDSLGRFGVYFHFRNNGVHSLSMIFSVLFLSNEMPRDSPVCGTQPP